MDFSRHPKNGKRVKIMSDCIFCKIVDGELPCSKIFENDACLAFLDIAPVNAGHALVLPKAHHARVWDLPADQGGELMNAISKVSKAVMDATGAAGVNVMQNNEEAAGQLVHHVHFHIIPRFDDDGLRLWPQGAYDSMEEMTRLAEKIGSRIS